MAAGDRVGVGVTLQGEDELAGGGGRAGHEACDGAGELAGDEQVAVAQRDVPALVLETGAQLFVVERQQRARGHDDLRLAQPGHGDQQGPVGDHEALVRAGPDDRLAQQRLHAAGRAPERDGRPPQRGGQDQAGSANTASVIVWLVTAPAHHGPNGSSRPVIGT